jgi:hypothetical protein
MRRAPRTIAILLANFLVIASPAAAAPSGSEKAGARQEERKPESKPPTIAETLSAVRVISKELKGIEGIEKRLAAIERHAAGIDASLVPVGNALKPEGLRLLADLVVDTAYERAKRILMLVTAFGALLIAFGAVMLRWSLSGRRAAPPSPSAPPQEPWTGPTASPR